MKESLMKHNGIAASCIVGLLAATPAAAQWAPLVEDDGGDRHFINPATVERNGNLRKVWQLRSHKQRGKQGEMSISALIEINCLQKRRRILEVYYHSGSMADGKTLVSLKEPGPWSDIPPQSVGGATLKAVCR